MNVAGAVVAVRAVPVTVMLMPSYSHKVAKNDVPLSTPNVAHTSMQIVLVGERLLAEIGHAVRFRR
ncbi:hypothetical protein [Streptomyces griseorubiginosus]|uniref:hypothetical protein n=1 Tax=Streptomyces griseorubiginosus TaxID=67304 RepID=UPI003649E086